MRRPKYHSPKESIDSVHSLPSTLSFIVFLSLGLGFITGTLITSALQLGTQLLSTHRERGYLDSAINRGNQLNISRRGHLHDSFVRQGLCHGAFHVIAFKQRLAALVRHHMQVAIVGVEWGAEAYALAKDGNVVNAFEPNPKYHAEMAKRVANDSRFHLYNVAIGHQQGSYQLSYRGLNEQVEMAPLSDFIHTDLDLLSVDVQGNFSGVIQGIAGLNIRSMWIEIFPCDSRLGKLIHRLDQQYVIFDIVPWGGIQGTNKETPLSQLGNEVGWSSRPSDIDSYLSWFCDIKKKYYNWLGTDIVAIRRDVLTPSMLNKINTIGNDAYIEQNHQPRRV